MPVELDDDLVKLCDGDPYGWGDHQDFYAVAATEPTIRPNFLLDYEEHGID